MQTIYSNSDPLSRTNAENPNEAPEVVSKKLYLMVPFFLILIIGAAYAISIKGRYVDYPNGCNIRINGDILNGNANTIYRAIKQIRDKDPDTYKILCSNIKYINESNCVYAEKDDSRLAVKQTDGCYIKGTGIIYLTPDGNGEDSATLGRIKAITKYAKKSTLYN